jgi:hypothetical protein
MFIDGVQLLTKSTVKRLEKHGDQVLLTLSDSQTLAVDHVGMWCVHFSLFGKRIMTMCDCAIAVVASGTVPNSDFAKGVMELDSGTIAVNSELLARNDIYAV